MARRGVGASEKRRDSNPPDVGVKRFAGHRHGRASSSASANTVGPVSTSGIGSTTLFAKLDGYVKPERRRLAP
jgi:ribosomal protein L27